MQQNGAMPVKTAVNYLKQIIGALEEVHAKDMLHRDIKPDNIMISNNGTAVLIDFGAARNFISEHTQTNTGIYTPGYAPKEQYASGKLDARTDIYGLCATFYYTLTAQKPIDAISRFPDDSLASLSQIDSDIPEWLSELIMKGLSPDMKNRFSSVSEMETAMGTESSNPVKSDKTSIAQKVVSIDEGKTTVNQSNNTKFVKDENTQYIKSVLNGIDYSIVEVLSSRFPFYVYKAQDRTGKFVVIKTVYSKEEVIKFNNDFFLAYYHDNFTSAYYGNRQASSDQINANILLKKQFDYLSKCHTEYNLNQLHFDKDSNGKNFYQYDYIEGVEFDTSEITLKGDLFLSIIPSLLNAVSKYPHGDLSFSNLIIHNSKKKFSIIDPSIESDDVFFTNPEFYPIVPPLFNSNLYPYATFADQLAIGLMFYKCLTGINPLSEFLKHPFWEKKHNYTILCSIISILPKNEFTEFNSTYYINEVKGLLNQKVTHYYSNHGFPKEFLDITPPILLNSKISKGLSDLCMSLILEYEPVEYYINKIQKIIS